MKAYKVVGWFAKFIFGIALWAIFMIAFLIFANVVFGATEEPTSPYREIIMNMTDEEIVEIQQVLCLEARDDTWEGRVCTAQVIFNRVLSDEFPNTVHGVLSQTKPCTQYSTYRRRHTAQYDETECDAIEYLCDCDADELYIGLDRLFQDNKPIGKNPIKIGRQYFGK